MLRLKGDEGNRNHTVPSSRKDQNVGGTSGAEEPALEVTHSAPEVPPTLWLVILLPSGCWPPILGLLGPLVTEGGRGLTLRFGEKNLAVLPWKT